MYNVVLQSIPGKILFRRDMILNTLFITDWEAIRRGKQQLIYKTTKSKINITKFITIEYVRNYYYTIKN